MTEELTEFQKALWSVLQSAEGRMVIKQILDSSGLETSAFNKEAAVRDFYLGRQSIGQQIAQEIRNLGPREWIEFLTNLEEDNARQQLDAGQ